jgi:hypothetical protein
MLLDWHRLAAEQFAPEAVAAVPHVHGRDMGELVIGQGEEALARAERLEGEAERSDVEEVRVVRRRTRRGIAIVAEVLEQNRGPFPRRPVEHLAVIGERVGERPADIGREIGLRRIEVQQPKVGRQQHRKIDLRCALRDSFLLGCGRLGLDRLLRRRRGIDRLLVGRRRYLRRRFLVSRHIRLRRRFVLQDLGLERGSDQQSASQQCRDAKPLRAVAKFGPLDREGLRGAQAKWSGNALCALVPVICHPAPGKDGAGA